MFEKARKGICEVLNCGSWLRAVCALSFFFFFSSRRRHTRFDCDWSSDVCSSDLGLLGRPWTSAAGQAALTAAGFTTLSGGFVAPYSNFLTDFGAGASTAQAQIGRASCRERV